MDLRQSTRELIIRALGWAYEQKSESITDWLRYGCAIQKSGITNNAHAIANGLEVGHILASISQLQPVQRSWVDYCYGPENNDLDRSQLGTYLFWKLRFDPDGRSYSRRLALCKAAVDDFRLRTSHSGKTLPIEAYAHDMGLKPTFDGRFPHWERDWRYYRDKSLDYLQDIDSESIGEVSITVKYLKGHQDDDYVPTYRVKSAI